MRIDTILFSKRAQRAFMIILLAFCVAISFMPLSAYSLEAKNVSISYSSKKSSSSKFLSYVSNGKTSGKAEAKTALNGIAIEQLSPDLDGDISYKAHFIKSGWSKSAKSGKKIKSSSKSNCIQAIKISLTGNLSKKYDIYYRTYVKYYGWLGWTKNGKPSGTKDMKCAIGAYQAKLVKKGAKAPGDTKDSYRLKPDAKQLAKYVKGISGKGFKSANTRYSLKSSAAKNVKKAINNIKRFGKRVSLTMIDINTGQTISYNGMTSLYSASILKGPYVAAINKYMPASVSSGTKSTMYSTVKYSSNEAYGSLHKRFGSNPMAKLQSYVGGCSFNYRQRYTYVSSKDMTRLWLGVYDYFFIHPNKNAKWCRSLYTNPTISSFRTVFKGKYATYSKYGWIDDVSSYMHKRLRSYNDCGIVMSKNGPYVVSILTNDPGGISKVNRLLRAIDVLHDDMMK